MSGRPEYKAGLWSRGELAGKALTMRTLIPTIGLLAIGAFAACGAAERAEAPSSGKVTGTVTYLVRRALPEDAVVTVRVLDASRQDVPAGIVGEHRIERPGQVPIPFEIRYDEDAIDPDRTYIVRADIRRDDRLLFTTSRMYPVITRGHPTQVEIIVELAGGN